VSDFRELIYSSLADSRDYGTASAGFDSFVDEVSSTLCSLTEKLGGLKTEVAEHLPPGTEQRAVASANSVQRLAQSLGRMTASEQWNWVSPTPELVAALGLQADDDIHKFQEAMWQWCRVAVAVAEAAEVSQSLGKSAPKSSKAESASGYVELLARVWLKHYGRWPSGAERSPFFRLVRDVLPHLTIDVDELSPPTVMAILKSVRPSNG